MLFFGTVLLVLDAEVLGSCVAGASGIASHANVAWEATSAAGIADALNPTLDSEARVRAAYSYRCRSGAVRVGLELSMKSSCCMLATPVRLYCPDLSLVALPRGIHGYQYRGARGPGLLESGRRMASAPGTSTCDSVGTSIRRDRAARASSRSAATDSGVAGRGDAPLRGRSSYDHSTDKVP